MNKADGNEPRIQPAEVGAEQRRQANVAVAHSAAAGDVDDAHERQRDRRAEQHRPHPSRLVSSERGDTQQRHADRRGDVDDLARQALGAAGRSS